MIDHSHYSFDLPRRRTSPNSIIKVIGVGGGGSNAVNHMFRLGIKDVEFVIANTDLQALNGSPVPNKLQIGNDLTEGLGCGANPDIGKAAALESKEQIRQMLQGTKMVFITAGMGGGTGTGAAPVIAKIAKEEDILTVGIVTVPFSWEGRKKLAAAQKGIDELRENCDTVIVILNDKLREIYGNLPIGDAFAQADNILTTGAKGIAEIITLAGHVNVDFQDVRTVMLNAGAAVMGTAEANGENRALNAAQGALTSPLLDNRDIHGAKKILLSIISGADAELSMDELSEITEYIQDQAGQEAEMIFGHGVDPELGDSIRVTIIATGFSGDEYFNPVETQPAARAQKEPRVHELDRGQIWLFDKPDNTVNEKSEITVRDQQQKPARPVQKPVENPGKKQDVNPPSKDAEDKKYFFTAPVNDADGIDNEPSYDGDDSLFSGDDEFTDMTEKFSDEMISEDGTMELRNTTRDRLQEQARIRKERLKEGRKDEMTREQFNEKWSLPAYLRRGVKMDNVPHSSESFISKYNLNDDNSILGNNKFLHDNVD